MDLRSCVYTRDCTRSTTRPLWHTHLGPSSPSSVPLQLSSCRPAGGALLRHPGPYSNGPVDRTHLNQLEIDPVFDAGLRCPFGVLLGTCKRRSAASHVRTHATIHRRRILRLPSSPVPSRPTNRGGFGHFAMRSRTSVRKGAATSAAFIFTPYNTRRPSNDLQKSSLHNPASGVPADFNRACLHFFE